MTKRKTLVSSISPETRELATAKLAESGLDWTDAEKLGITAHDSLATLHKSFEPVPGLKFVFTHPMTGEPLTYWPAHPQHYRVRKLRDVVATGFDAQLDPSAKKDRPKYLQPPGTGICAYFPSNIDWQDVLLDTEQPFIITEGELKAAKACKEGFYCIGLGGVDSYRAANWGHAMLPELESVQWVGRKVVIAYDSDAAGKLSVTKALNKLAELLMEHGAKPHFIPMPDIDGLKKTGLDDYLVHEGPEELMKLIATAELLTHVKELFQFNNRYAYVKDLDRVLELRKGILRAPDTWSKQTEAKAIAFDRFVTQDGEVKHMEISAAPAWLKWRSRSEIQRIDYMPAHEAHEIVELEHDELVYNTWPGWGYEPAKGDVTLFKQLCQHLFSKADPGDLEWFYQWLAYPLQHPGTKLMTATLIWSRAHGTGKSFLGEIMGDIYGKNFKELDQIELMGSFNSWAEAKQFVLVNEVEGNNRRESTMMFKNFITQQSKSINKKHMNPFDEKSCTNFYFTSNLSNAILLEDTDRRLFIIEGPDAPLSEEFYRIIKAWRFSGTGPAAIHHWLSQEVSTKNFDPSAPARITRAKREMQGTVVSDMHALLVELKDHPEAMLRLGDTKIKGDLFTSEDLKSILDPMNVHGKGAQEWGTNLTNAGFNKATDKGNTITWRGRSKRLYIVRNEERWIHATPAEIRKHLDESDMSMPETKSKKF